MSLSSKSTTKRKLSDDTSSSFVPIDVPLALNSENQPSILNDETTYNLEEKCAKFTEVNPQQVEVDVCSISCKHEQEHVDHDELFERQLAGPSNYTEKDGEDWVNVELDSMWAEVCENLLSETEECELRDWETDEDDFVEVRDNLTFDLDHSDLTASVSEMSQEAPSNDNIPTQYEQPLYPGAKVTIGAVMVLLSLFTIRYDVTGDAIVHLLKLLSLILPCGHILPKTLLNFKKFFSNLECPLTQLLPYVC